MKMRLFLACCALAIFAPTLSAKEKPGMDVIRAAKLASDYLAGLGAGAPYIVSITLDEGALINGQPSWVVHWSKPIVNGGDKELGVRVRGDGTVVRLIEGKGSHSTRQPAALDIR